MMASPIAASFLQSRRLTRTSATSWKARAQHARRTSSPPSRGEEASSAKWRASALARRAFASANPLSRRINRTTNTRASFEDGETHSCGGGKMGLRWLQAGVATI